MKKQLIFLSLVLFFLSSCEKGRTYRKLVGTWSLYEYKLDGSTVDFGENGSTLVFNPQNKQNYGELYKFPIEGGYKQLSNFSFTYETKGNKLKLIHGSKYIEEFEIIKLRSSTGAISYAEEEDAPAEFLKLKNNNEEFYFKKVK